MKRKILFLLHLPPPVHGSSIVGKSIRDSTAINSAFSCRYLNLLASRQIGESGKISIRKLVGFVKTGLSVLYEVLRERPEACYFALTSTGFAFFRDAVLVAFLKLSRVRLIYHLHNKGINSKQGRLIYKLAYRFVFRNSMTILLSRHLYADIQAFVPVNKVLYCANGISQRLDSERADVDRSGKSAIVNVLFLSNLIESKGALVLLEACAVLKRKGVTFSCDFVGAEGDISVDKFISHIKRLNLETEVRYLGGKYGVDKENTLLAADIFALPTYYKFECLPLVVLEAMRHALPVVSCPEGGIPDLVIEGETGFLVPQRDEMALADKLELLINHQELRDRMGAAGKNRYDAEFTLASFEERFVEVMQEAVGYV